MTARRHGTRAKGGKRVSKTPKAAAAKPKVWFSGMRSRNPQVAAVEQIINEPDPRKRFDLEQKLFAAEAVRQAKADGERQARRAHELGRAHPGQRIGAGELLDMLVRDTQRHGGTP